MKVCAFIVTYNRLDLLKKCVSALSNQTRKLDELVIINNGSTDDTSEWLARLSNDVTVINQDNVGGAGGYRRGFEYAYEQGYDWIMPFDDDCEPDLDYLKNAESYLMKEEWSICTGQFFDEGKDQLFSGAEMGSWYEEKKLEDASHVTEDAGFPFLFVSRKIIDKVGFPHKFWFIYLDDTEWLSRIRNADFEIGLLPVYAGTHHSGRESRFVSILGFRKEIQTYSEWKTYYIFRNTIIYKRIIGLSFLSVFLKNLGKLSLVFFQKGSIGSRLKIALKASYEGFTMDVDEMREPYR